MLAEGVYHLATWRDHFAAAAAVRSGVLLQEFSSSNGTDFHISVGLPIPPESLLGESSASVVCDWAFGTVHSSETHMIVLNRVRGEAVIGRPRKQ